MKCEAIDDLNEAIDLPNAEPVDPDAVEELIGRKSPNFRKARGLCRWCKAPKHERRSLAAFCSDRCRAAFHNQSKTRGAQVVNVLIRWRRYRRPEDFSLLCAMAGQFIREDKAEDRDFYPDPPPSAYAKTVGRNVAGKRRR